MGDLSHIAKAKGKKPRNDQDDASDGEGRNMRNPGSVYFRELFGPFMGGMKNYLSNKASNEGSKVNIGMQQVCKVLYNFGCETRKGMKASGQNDNMVLAFYKDHGDDEVVEMPGPKMLACAKDYMEFMKKEYPDLWARFPDEYWRQQNEKAAKAFNAAYDAWKESREAGADAVKPTKQTGKRPAVTSPGTESDSDDDQQPKKKNVVGIQGLNRPLGGSAREDSPVPPPVAPPGVPLPRGSPPAVPEADQKVDKKPLIKKDPDMTIFSGTIDLTGDDSD